jgi:hypothetical protein
VEVTEFQLTGTHNAGSYCNISAELDLICKTLMVERFGDKYTRKLTQHEVLDALWPV